MKITILFPKFRNVKAARARKPIEMSDTIKKQVKDDAKKSAKAVTKKKKSPTKGKKSNAKK